MDKKVYICINAELIEQNICWKSKYIAALVKVAYKMIGRGYYWDNQIHSKPRRYLETVESRELRHGVKWLEKEGIIKVTQNPYGRGLWKVELSDYGKSLVKIEGGE